LVAISVGITLVVALACGGGEATDEVTDEVTDEAGDDDDKEIVIVPVDGGGGPHHCCAVTEDGKERHTLAKGPAECQNRLGGTWVEGSMCIPCCCKSPHDPDDRDKGHTYELTTPGSCAGVGECVTDDVPECPANREGDDPPAGDDDDDKAQPDPKPRPRPTPRPRPRPRPGGPTGARPK
jgi:hypothetical protein